MRDGKTDGSGKKEDDGKPGEIGSNGANSFSQGSASTDVSPEKVGGVGTLITATTGNAVNNNIADDISPEGLLEVISQEWKNELERLKSKGLNGYKRRKESRNECLV